MLCYASLLKTESMVGPEPTRKCRWGWGRRGEPRAPCLQGRGEGAAPHPAAAAPRWLFQLGMLFKKASLGGEHSGLAALQGAASPWP